MNQFILGGMEIVKWKDHILGTILATVMECDRSNLKEDQIILAHSFRGSWVVLMGQKAWLYKGLYPWQCECWLVGPHTA